MATKAAIKSTKKSTTSKSVTVTATSSSAAMSGVKAFNKLLNDMKEMPIIGKAVAEFIGTFLLVAFFLSLTIAGGPIMVSFALAGIVLVVGGVSGAHLNPAVTFGAWVTRKISSMNAFCYVVAQTLGAFAAWSVLSTYLEATKPSALSLAGQSAPALLKVAAITDGKQWLIFFAELLGVAILSFGVATALRAKRNKVSAALTQGFAILIALTVAGSLTVMMVTSGTTLTFLNPVIAAAANGLSWNTWPIAIYVLAPVIGGVVGFALQDFLHSQNCDNDHEKCNC